MILTYLKSILGIQYFPEYPVPKLIQRRAIGLAITKMRQAYYVSDIEGFSPRQVANIQDGSTILNKAILKRLAKAHRMSEGLYLISLARFLENTGGDR